VSTVEIATILALLGLVAATAAVIKSLPIIWSFFKRFFQFFLGMERMSALPDVMENQKKILLEQGEIRLENQKAYGQINIKLDTHTTILNSHEDRLNYYDKVTDKIISHMDIEEDRLDTMIKLFMEALGKIDHQSDD